MRTVAVVFADFVEAAPGGPSQLGTELAGQTILTRTLRRLVQVEGLTGRCLFVRPRDREQAARVLREAGLENQIELLPEDPGVRPRRQLICTARKWNLESWRSNPLGMTWFDEFVEPATVAHVLKRTACDAVFCFDGHQPLLDPAIATAMLATLNERPDECSIVFTQAPPGLAGIILQPRTVENLLDLTIPLGLLLSYRPELAQPDPITSPNCYHVAPEVMQTAGRFTGDTRRSRELIEAALRDLGENTSAEALCRWAAAPGHDRAGPLPVEVELELTTDDPLPETTLHPRGDRVPRRQLRDIVAVARLAEQLAEYDDRLVFLGGHGDPLQHPQFAEVCRILHSAGVYGIGVGTPLVDLTDASLEAILEYQVDAVEVRLDAYTAATYQRVHGVDAFERAVANVEKLERVRRERGSAQPAVVCSLTRCAATIAEMEAFHDHWIKAVGSSVIHGYNNYCGAFPPDSLLPTCPPIRQPCRRLDTRLMLLADNLVPLCAQDFRGETRLGDWASEALRDVWTGKSIEAARLAHDHLDLGALPLCQSCTEWHRP